MTTVKTTLPVVFSGSGTSLPLFLHDIPVAGYTRRYVAASSSATAGVSVTSLTDLSAAPSTALASVSGAPTMRVDGTKGFKYLEVASGQDLRSNYAQAGPHTLAVVARMPASGNGTARRLAKLFSGGSLMLSVTTGNLLQAYGGSTLNSALSVDNNWHVFVFVANATSSVIRLDNQTEATGSSSASQVTSNSIRFGLSSTDVANSAVDLAEAIFWGSALSSPDRASVVTALKAAYNI